MNIKINPNEVNTNDPKQIALFQLLCSLSVSHASLKWYMGEEAGRANLPTHEEVIVLAIAIAGIGETLHKFDELVTKGIIQKPDNCDEMLEGAWKLINSKAVKEIKKSNLKYIRDKSSFHFDPEPIKHFFDDAKKENKELDLWEYNDESPNGYSPLASLIISNTLISVTKPDKSRAETSIKVYGALSYIILDELNEKYTLEVSQ